MAHRSTPTETEPLSTIPREAKKRKIGVRVLREAARRGELPVYRVGGWPRVRPSEVDRWIESQRMA